MPEDYTPATEADLQRYEEWSIAEGPIYFYKTIIARLARSLREEREALSNRNLDLAGMGEQIASLQARIAVLEDDKRQLVYAFNAIKREVEPYLASAITEILQRLSPDNKETPINAG